MLTAIEALGALCITLLVMGTAIAYTIHTVTDWLR
jgi:hypothetical protein